MTNISELRSCSIRPSFLLCPPPAFLLILCRTSSPHHHHRRHHPPVRFCVASHTRRLCHRIQVGSTVARCVDQSIDALSAVACLQLPAVNSTSSDWRAVPYTVRAESSSFAILLRTSQEATKTRNIALAPRCGLPLLLAQEAFPDDPRI